MLALYCLPHRRALHHALPPCRVGAELVHGKSTAHAPAVENKRVGIDERVLAAHDPVFSLEHGVDFLAIGPERFPPRFLYRGLRDFAFGETLGPVSALIRGMHDAGEPAHSADAARLLGRIGRHQFFLRKPPCEVSEYRGVLDKDLAVDAKRRYFTPRVDLQVGFGPLLLLGEQNRFCLVRRAGFFETDMRGQRTSAGTEKERQHGNPPHLSN